MKKKSKITGEIDDIEITEISIPKDKIIGVVTHQDGVKCKFTYSRRTFSEEWEDYEELKDFYYIQPDGDIHIVQCKVPEYQLERFKYIGNYFETREEAEKALEKLKAWQRLKEGGFRFLSWDSKIEGQDHFDCCGMVFITGGFEEGGKCKKDLDLLFGGEE